VIHACVVGLRQEAAMRIDGEGTTEFDATVLDEGAAFTFLAEALLLRSAKSPGR
jgi:hypothetical protein